MKAFFVFAIFFCLTFTVYSQNSEKYKALSDSMERTISSSTSKMESYDDQTRESGNTRSFINYNRRYQILKDALNESERKLDLLIRTNDRFAKIKEERDNYEVLLQHLEDLKSEYDSWMRNVQ